MSARFKLICFSVFLLSAANIVKGQQQALSINLTGVNADILLHSLDPVPFDQPFIINGKVDADVVGVGFSYKLVDTRQKSLILQSFKQDQPIMAYMSNNAFAVKCNGVQPNREYAFSFYLYKKIGDDIKAKIKNVIAKELENYVRNPNSDFTLPSTDRLQQKISDQIANLFPVVTLVNAKYQPVVPADAFKIPDVANILSDLYSNARKVHLFESGNKKAYIDNILEYLAKDGVKTVLTALAKPENLSAASQALLKEDLLADNSRFKGLSMANFNLYFSYLLAHPDIVSGLLSGRTNYANGSYYNSDKTDIDFVKLIDVYLSKIRFLRWTGASPSAADLRSIEDLESVFRKFIDEFSHYEMSESAILKDSLVKQIPDVFAGYFVGTNYTISKAVQVDGTSNNTPYISLDAGIGYNTGFDNFFSYLGVNIYLTPVEKSVKLKTYAKNPALYLLKTMSIDVGVINNYFYNNNPNTRYVSALGGNKDVLVGLGYRFCRIAKLNVGSVLYFLKDPDPMSTKKSLTGKFCASLSLDINIVKAFSEVGKAFGLLN